MPYTLEDELVLTDPGPTIFHIFGSGGERIERTDKLSKAVNYLKRIKKENDENKNPA